MTTPLYFEDCLQLRRLTPRGDPALRGEALCVVETDLGIPERVLVWCAWDEDVESLLRGWSFFFVPRAKVEVAVLSARVAILARPDGAPQIQAQVIPRVTLAAADIVSSQPRMNPAMHYVPGVTEAQVNDWNATVGEGVPVLFRPFGNHDGFDYAMRLTAGRAHLQGSRAMVRLSNGCDVPLGKVERA